MKITNLLALTSFVLGNASLAGSLTCYGTGDVKGQHLSLNVIDQATVNFDGINAKLDPTYKPKSTNENFKRFLMTVKPADCKGSLLIEAPVLANQSGKLKYQCSGEGFESHLYICR